jgi:hypothetical protein
MTNDDGGWREISGGSWDLAKKVDESNESKVVIGDILQKQKAKRSMTHDA